MDATSGDALHFLKSALTMYLLYQPAQKDAEVALVYTNLTLRISALRLSCAGFVLDDDDKPQPSHASSLDEAGGAAWCTVAGASAAWRRDSGSPAWGGAPGNSGTRPAGPKS